MEDVRRADLRDPADTAVVARLRRAWTEERAGGPIEDPTFALRFDDWLRREADQRLTWLGYAGGEPVGMLNVVVFTRMPWPRADGVDRPGHWAYLANFYVAPAHRGGGLGSRLLDACTRHADEQRFARIVLSPSERSVPLYARAGFAPATGLMLRPPGGG